MTATQIHPSIRLIPGEAKTEKKVVFVAWLKHDERTALVGKHLGADVYFIQWGARKWYTVPFRYLWQAFLTWPLLMREKPDVVLVQIPPIPSAIVVYLYAKLFNKQYILDTHSNSFKSKVGRLTQGLHAFLSRNALTTLIHNSDFEETVASWNAPLLRLGYTPDEYPEGTPYDFVEGAFNVVFVCTFSVDEPVENVLEAARMLPDVHIYITGNYKRAPQYLENKPDNVTFTGYIDHEEFIGLLRGTDVIMDLTTQDSTVLMGGYEAISLEKPLVTSDWPILRQYFDRGTIHTDNTPQGIADGIRQSQAELESLQSDIAELHTELLAEWDEHFGELQRLIAEA